MKKIDISPDTIVREAGAQSEQVAALLLALRAALTKAEIKIDKLKHERDEARKERSHQQGRADANSRKTAQEQARADTSFTTGYHHGVQKAALVVLEWDDDWSAEGIAAKILSLAHDHDGLNSKSN